MLSTIYNTFTFLKSGKNTQFFLNYCYTTEKSFLIIFIVSNHKAVNLHYLHKLNILSEYFLNNNFHKNSIDQQKYWQRFAEQKPGLSFAVR